MISIIVAMDEKRGIGKDNKIPWHIREDLIHLKKLTLGHTVILGRNSYESMVWYYDRSGKEMPGRVYIVVTHDQHYKPIRSNALVAHSVDDAIEIARKQGDEEIFVLGGGKVFAQALPYVQKLYITLVKGDFGADTFFPDYSEFTKVVRREEGLAGEYSYTFLDFEK